MAGAATDSGVVVKLPDGSVFVGWPAFAVVKQMQASPFYAFYGSRSRWIVEKLAGAATDSGVVVKLPDGSVFVGWSAPAVVEQMRIASFYDDCPTNEEYCRATLAAMGHDMPSGTDESAYLDICEGLGLIQVIRTQQLYEISRTE